MIRRFNKNDYENVNGGIEILRNTVTGRSKNQNKGNNTNGHTHWYLFLKGEKDFNDFLAAIKGNKDWKELYNEVKLDQKTIGSKLLLPYDITDNWNKLLVTLNAAKVPYELTGDEVIDPNS